MNVTVIMVVVVVVQDPKSPPFMARSRPRSPRPLLMSDHGTPGAIAKAPMDAFSSIVEPITL